MTAMDMAAKIAHRLIGGLPAEQVWLFGSQARGDASPDSDLDILAIVGEAKTSRVRQTVEAYSLVADIQAPKDIIILTREQWVRQKEVVNTIPYLALKEGILLHEK